MEIDRNDHLRPERAGDGDRIGLLSAPSISQRPPMLTGTKIPGSA